MTYDRKISNHHFSLFLYLVLQGNHISPDHKIKYKPHILYMPIPSFFEEKLYSTSRLHTRRSVVNQLLIVYVSSIESRTYNLLTSLSTVAVTVTVAVT